jgi:hypothetical protein
MIPLRSSSSNRSSNSSSISTRRRRLVPAIIFVVANAVVTRAADSGPSCHSSRTRILRRPSSNNIVVPGMRGGTNGKRSNRLDSRLLLLLRRDHSSFLGVRGGGIGDNDIAAAVVVDVPALLDVEWIAKIGTALWSIHAAYIVLSPKKSLHLHGIMARTPLLTWMNRRVGVGLAHIAIVSWCLFFGGMTTNQALGHGFLPWIIVFASALLNDDAKELGLSPVLNVAQVVLLGMVGFGAHACWTDAVYADTTVQVIGASLLLHGIPMCLAPEANGKPLGFPSSVFHNLLARHHGVSLMASGIFMACLGLGVDAPVALGYSMIPFCLHQLVLTFVLRAVDQLGMPKLYNYTWLAFLAAMSSTLAVEFPLPLAVSCFNYTKSKLEALLSAVKVAVPTLAAEPASQRFLKIVI